MAGDSKSIIARYKGKESVQFSKGTVYGIYISKVEVGKSIYYSVSDSMNMRLERYESKKDLLKDWELLNTAILKI